MARSKHLHVAAHELSVVLVGSEHIGVDALAVGFLCERTHHVVGLETGNLQYRYMHSREDILDDRHRLADILWRLFALRLILLVSLVAERRTVRVESHTEICGLFLLQHLVESVAETHHRRRVQPL